MSTRIICAFFALFALAAVFCAAGEAPVLTSREAAHILLFAPQPRYPQGALFAGFSGSGIFQLVVGKTGQVTAVSVMKSTGYRILDDAATQALMQWRFKPGVGVIRANIPITFKP
jgi:protein TonB